MKKLMIAAAVAAMTVGAFAGPCDDPEVVSPCRAWDVKMSLKSLGPKKTTCKVEATDPCDDPTTEVVYYLDNVTRKVTGYLWICDYDCGAAANVVLWDSKNKVALIAYAEDAVEFDDVFAYGKKATKIAGTIEFAGADAAGNDALDVVASGINGKMVRGNGTDECYIKSLSGYASGRIAYIKPGSDVIPGVAGKLCDEPVAPVVCDEFDAKILPFCDACCFEGWCNADNADDMIPATGTWSMKYNKKVSKGNTPIAQLAPAYAL